MPPINKYLICFFVILICGMQAANSGLRWRDIDPTRIIREPAQVIKDVVDTGAKTIDDVATTTKNAIDDTFNTADKAVKDTSKFVDQRGRELGDFGRNFNRESIRAGHNINNAAIATGKKLEKIGQNFGKALEDLVDFSLDCDPTLPPEDLADAYKSSCDFIFRRYKNSVKHCISAGGTSMIAAGVISSPETFGASLALAKVAHIICKTACNHEKALNRCIQNVDKEALKQAKDAQTESTETNQLERLASEYECIDQALVQELSWRTNDIIMQCENSPNCNTKSEEFKTTYVSKAEALNAQYKKRRDEVFDEYNNKQSLNEVTYEAHIRSNNISALSLTNGIKDREPINNQCAVSSNQIYLFSEIKNYKGKKVYHRWFFDKQLMFEKEFDIDGPRWRVWSSKKFIPAWSGIWVVDIIGENNTLLAQKQFLYVPFSKEDI